jgi:methionyl-tRNA formyltransferase
MRLVFLGSDPFAVPPLEALIAAGHQVVLVVTNPDRPKGRSGAPQPTAVKEVALRHGIPCHQPEGKVGAETVEAIKASGAELGVVVAFGSFLVKTVREAPSLGFMINVHASLLPRWRGAAPDAYALLAGDAETGVTIQRVEKVLDGGPVVATRRTPIGPDETRGVLRPRLGQLGAELVVEAVASIAAGTARFVDQDVGPGDANVTHAPAYGKEFGQLDLTRPADELARRVRAANPWPMASLELKDGPMQVLAARPVEGSGAPGEVLRVGAGEGEVVVATGAGALALVEVKPAGKKAMAAAAWARGKHVAPGSRLL